MQKYTCIFNIKTLFKFYNAEKKIWLSRTDSSNIKKII